MKKHPTKILSRHEMIEHLPSTCEEYAMVENPNGVYPPVEFCPLAVKKTIADRGVLAVVMDMDGTTTTTEALCLHSLEMMVRRITGRLSKEDWEGLSPSRDYPHIIGNSTTKHVEYLVRTYRHSISLESFRLHGVKQAVWTLENSQDEGRKNEVIQTLHRIGAGSLLEDQRFLDLVLRDVDPSESTENLFAELARTHLEKCDLENFSNQVRLAIDIYYHRYHEILMEIKAGEGALLAEEILGSRGNLLIESMPGVAVFLALVKGWLGQDAELLADFLTEVLPDPPPASQQRLGCLGAFFEKHPARVGVVTSSIRYEAEIVLNEVFKTLRSEIRDWPLDSEKIENLLHPFEFPERYYDAITTASDSHEIRLKPHRDLYTIALRRLGIEVGQFDQVVGFEDSESGTLAIRAAGIPLCVAVPFDDSSGHSLEAASHVCPGGLPEVLLNHQMFLSEEFLKEFS